MKRHINQKLRRILSVGSIGLVGFFGAACTDDYDAMNKSKTSLVVLTPAEYPKLFSQALSQGSYHPSYQTATNLFADLYAQYFATSTPNFQSDRYFTNMSWINSHWNPIYIQVVPQLRTLFENYDAKTAEHSVASIWWVFSFHRVTDYYGPIPYFDAGIPAQSVKYDAQDAIYDDFFKRLDAAVAVLKTKTGEKPFGSADIMYAGDVNKWIKFANTLRLRLALRISKVDPARAKTEAEAAVAAGVLTTASEDAMMVRTAVSSADANGLSRIAAWGEFRMSATMESILKGYKDPRMEQFFQPAFKTKTYEGMRNGLSPGQLIEELNTNDNNSNIGARWIRNTGTGSGWENLLAVKADIMHAAEAYFLKAEGALNGWNMGGDAKGFYEEGIRQSMATWGYSGAVVETYVNGTTPPIAPGDSQNSPAVSNIPVKWGATVAEQREQIGTQKWLALYPDGSEAWAEFRRSLFPKLYHVVNSVNPDVPNTGFIRRFPFIDSEKANNKAAVTEAVKLLKGEDKASTPLWWDKN
ncbi:SusD/RagB family nutrient-binding outer membrane lipoprotein [Dyadobacter sp. LHD-138]|uniref:SusD/RagB family nutrient-binding outer membrane lipoprotein n=1 Tax=Dyadobacter sp. LHD-138 TaxID=3071413 RepID=UPI0027E02718|nr:SusD/RagB family nutrient-binding outer membrane lipoprotein [Dyadobacter sp. LHD-138]MDQ6477122.1 SusD/RagB family nutrient-binding outer membrane lipoprotein [Dyadobacter sp. LHD-138]